MHDIPSPLSDKSQSVYLDVSDLLEQCGPAFDKALQGELRRSGAEIGKALLSPGQNPWRRILVQSVWRQIENDFLSAATLAKLRRKSRRLECHEDGRREKAARRNNLFLRYMVHEEFNFALRDENFDIGAAIGRYIDEVAQGAVFAIGDSDPDEKIAPAKEARDLALGLVEQSVLRKESTDRAEYHRNKQMESLRENWWDFRKRGRMFKIKVNVEAISKQLSIVDGFIDSLDGRAIAVVTKMLAASPVSAFPDNFQIGKISRGQNGRFRVDATMSGAFVSTAGLFTDAGPDGAHPISVPAWDWQSYDRAIADLATITGLIFCDGERAFPDKPSHFERLLDAELIQKLDYVPKEVRDRAAPFLFLSKWNGITID